MPPVPDCVCIRCAQRKLDLYAACPACGFTPATNEDFAKTLILSEVYELYGYSRARSYEQLRQAWAELRAGTFEFDPLEVSEVAAYFDRQERYFASLTKTDIARETELGCGWLLLLPCSVGAWALYQSRHYLPAAVAATAATAYLLVISRRIWQFHSRPGPDDSAYWLAEPRALTVTPAEGTFQTELPVSAEVASYFARFACVRVRHTGIEIAPIHVGRPKGKRPLTRIGVYGEGELAVDPQNGKIYELEGGAVSRVYAGLGAYLTSICDEYFPHLAREQPPGAA
jgi:hypothetical protein